MVKIQMKKTEEGTITGVWMAPNDFPLGKDMITLVEGVSEEDARKYLDNNTQYKKYLIITGFETSDARVNKTPKKHLILEGR